LGQGKGYFNYMAPDGEHWREPVAVYTAYPAGQFLPPYWDLVRPDLAQASRETARDRVHGGEASVRVLTQPEGGLLTRSTLVDEGRKYRLSAWVYLERGAVRVAFPLNSKAPTPTIDDIGSWRQITCDVAPESYRIDVQFLGAPGHEETLFYVDDVSLKEVVGQDVLSGP
jgi:hypothetical protein